MSLLVSLPEMRCPFAVTRYAVCLREPNPQSRSPRVPESARCVPLPLLAALVSRPSRVHRVHSRLQSGCQCLRVPESTSYVLTPTECRCPSLSDSAIPPRSPENSDRLRPSTLASLLAAACAPSEGKGGRHTSLPRTRFLLPTKQGRNPAGADGKSRSGRAAPSRPTPPQGAARPRPRSRGPGPRRRRPRLASFPSAGAEAAARASAPPARRQAPGRKISGRRLPERCPAGRSPCGSGKSPAPGSPSR